MLMATAALLLAGTVCLPSEEGAVLSAANGVNRESLYKRGITFERFLDQAVKRRQMWLDNYEHATVPDDLLQRARGIPGRWRLLVVAEDWCSDSASTIPYLARLVAAVDGLEMRIINSETGREVMEDHRTPDGRAATPTVVLLDGQFEEVGCFVERPSELQEWALEHRQDLDDDEFLKQKSAWYDRDAGRQTMGEVVLLMERAAGSSSGC